MPDDAERGVARGLCRAQPDRRKPSPDEHAELREVRQRRLQYLAERRTRGDIQTHDAAAWALYRVRRLDEARRESDAALALGTRDATLLFHAGAIRLAQGDESGRRLLQDALALNPSFDYHGAAEAKLLLAMPPSQLAAAR